MNRANFYMEQQIKRIWEHGFKDINPRPKYADGTPAHTISANHSMRQYDLSKDQFPICTLRPQAWKSAIKEVLWIYQDASNSLDLLENKYGIGWWRDWESKDHPGSIGQRYGATVKKYNLLNNLLEDIQKNPYGRRHIMSLWQEEDFKETDGLMPCCYETIWNVREEYLDMMMIQRSGDMLTASGPGGVNEIQYAALLMMIARHTGYKPGIFTHIVANEQIYDRHIDAADEMLKRFYFSAGEENPKMILNSSKTNFFDFTIEDFELINYNPIKPQLKLELGI